MYYRYTPYSYYKRNYELGPYYLRRYYPFHNYQQNIINSQIADINQNIDNYGIMDDVIQNSDVYQSMASDSENVGVCTEPPA